MGSWRKQAITLTIRDSECNGDVTPTSAINWTTTRKQFKPLDRAALDPCITTSDSGDPSDPGADLLDRGHEWIRQDHGPEKAIAELRSYLRVSGNSTGIIIRRTRDETRSEFLEKDFNGASVALVSREFGFGCGGLSFHRQVLDTETQAFIVRRFVRVVDTAG
jgi:hypothetical protein